MFVVPLSGVPPLKLRIARVITNAVALLLSHTTMAVVEGWAVSFCKSQFPREQFVQENHVHGGKIRELWIRVLHISAM